MNHNDDTIQIQEEEEVFITNDGMDEEEESVSSSEDSSESSSYWSSSSSSNSNHNSNHKGPFTTILPYVNTATYHIRNRRRNNTSSQRVVPPNISTASLPSSNSITQSSHRRMHNHRYKPNRNISNSPPSIISYYKRAIHMILSRKSSILLLFSLFVWFYVQYNIAYQAQKQSTIPLTPHELQIKRIQDRLEQIKKQKQNEQSAMEALGSAVSSLFNRKNSIFQRKRNNRVKPSKDGYVSDPIPIGCSTLDWHEINYQNCNDVHDLDLKEIFHKRHGALIPMDLGEGDKSEIMYSKETLEKAASMGYLGSGMWRQVWKVHPRIANEDAVLKIMKSEHNVDGRNFDRHRRDAIVMERMQNSSHVVSIYGFCGNTVLTEYSGLTLSDYIYSTEEYNDVVVPYDKHTMLGKIDLAIDLLKGLKDIHELKIVHADIQAKQFLVDPIDGLKLNDFNRCRFLPKHNKTGESCLVKIPSAPGGNRSPEEYELSKLDEKIDVFSAGNVLYGILTGKKPWTDVSRDTARKNVMRGILPAFPREYERDSIEEAFGKLIYKAYEFNAKKRPSANDLIHDFSLLRERAITNNL